MIETIKNIAGESWGELLLPIFKDRRMLECTTKLLSLERKNVKYFPEKDDIFRAFKLTPLDKLKVVIIGQDPYHTPGKATGLAFGVPTGERLPPSLKIIFNEIGNTYFSHDFPPKEYSEYDSTLENWAEQGVLLLNTALTVEQGNPGSHSNLWNWFTLEVLKSIAKQKDFVVFVKWGKHAQRFVFLEDAKHIEFEGPHPMAEQYSGGKTKFKSFFKEINESLENNNLSKIKWY